MACGTRYRWGVLLFPCAVVAASPVILLVAVVTIFRAIYPDRVMQVGDSDGAPMRWREALARWRQRYAGLDFGQRVVRSFRVWQRDRKARRTSLWRESIPRKQETAKGSFKASMGMGGSCFAKDQRLDEAAPAHPKRDPD